MSTSHAHDALLAIHPKGLLAVYSIVPLTAGVILVDGLLFRHGLREMLPANPETLRAYTFLFILPHVVSSAASFLDADYVRFYRAKILAALGVAFGLGFVVPSYGGMWISLMAYVIYTMYHLITQQTGIALFMTGKPTRSFLGWRWSLIGASIVIYFLILVGSQWTGPPVGNAPLQSILKVGVVPLSLALVVFFSWRVTRTAQTRVGRWYVWANAALLVVIGACYFARYTFFSIALARVVHDITGFYFYSTHDFNRNSRLPKNLLYRSLEWAKIPLYLLSPVLGIFLANVILSFRYYGAVQDFLLILGYFHYYTEGFMWKKDSIHRRFVAIKQAA